MTKTARAVRTLKKSEKWRRLNSILCVIIGLAVCGSGLWVQFSAAEMVEQTIELFEDSPTTAIEMVVPTASTMTLAHLNIFLGLGFAGFWAVRFFVPDPKTTVLLELLEQSGLDKNSD